MDEKLKSTLGEWTVLIGRILFGLIFFKAAFDHFSPALINEAEKKGLFLPHLLVPLSGVVAIVGGLLIILGYKTKLGTGLIIKFLIPVTIVMHDFWNFVTPHWVQLEFDQFTKNIGLLGAALILFHFGPGRFSLDAKLKKNKSWKSEKHDLLKVKKEEIVPGTAI